MVADAAAGSEAARVAAAAGAAERVGAGMAPIQVARKAVEGTAVLWVTAAARMAASSSSPIARAGRLAALSPSAGL